VVATIPRLGRQNCALLGYYAASSGNFLPTFRDNLSVSNSRIKNSKRKPVTSVHMSSSITNQTTTDQRATWRRWLALAQVGVPLSV